MNLIHFAYDEFMMMNSSPKNMYEIREEVGGGRRRRRSEEVGGGGRRRSEVHSSCNMDHGFIWRRRMEEVLSLSFHFISQLKY